MLGKKIINTGSVACTTDTTQILDGGTTQSTALYRFEDNANDTASSTGKFNKGGIFNGSSSVVTINSLFDFSSSFSISMWFNADTLPSGTYIPLFFTDGYGGSNSDYGIAFYLYGNTIKPWIDRQGTYTNIFTAGTLSTGTWYHVLLNRDYNSKWELFLNGSSLGTYTSAGLTDNYTPNSFSTIGKHATSAMWFDGKIDQTRIFNKTLNTGEINSLYNETTTTAALGTISNPSTVAYYKMQDATDETGSYNLTASNVDFNVKGKYGFAGKFNGTNSYLYAANSVQQPTKNFSVSCWVNFDTIKAASTGIVANFKSGGTPQVGWAIAHQNGTPFQFWADGTASSNAAKAQGTTNPVAGTWYNIVGTYDGTNIKIYVNGSLEGTTAYSTTPAQTDQPLVIGRWYGNYNDYYTDGKIDQVRIFNKAISATEVTTLYNEIQCANTITTPESYFNTVLYTGNRPSSQSITGVGFQPDLVWAKAVSYTHLTLPTNREV